MRPGGRVLKPRIALARALDPLRYGPHLIPAAAAAARCVQPQWVTRWISNWRIFGVVVALG
jgi:hypothetical protein